MSNVSQIEFEMNSRADNSDCDDLSTHDNELDSSRFTHVSFGNSSEPQYIYSLGNSGDTQTDCVTVLSFDSDGIDNENQCSGLVYNEEACDCCMTILNYVCKYKITHRYSEFEFVAF